MQLSGFSMREVGKPLKVPLQHNHRQFWLSLTPKWVTDRDPYSSRAVTYSGAFDKCQIQIPMTPVNQVWYHCDVWCTWWQLPGYMTSLIDESRCIHLSVTCRWQITQHVGDSVLSQGTNLSGSCWLCQWQGIVSDLTHTAQSVTISRHHRLVTDCAVWPPLLQRVMCKTDHVTTRQCLVWTTKSLSGEWELAGLVSVMDYFHVSLE